MVNGESLKLDNSPVEFVLIGPDKGKSSILVRSENAKLDLIAIGTNNNSSDQTNSIVLSRINNSKNRNIYSVWSYPISPSHDEEENRKREYLFCWVGSTSYKQRKLIRDVFNQNIADIYKGLYEKDVQTIELGISPVILECVRSNLRTKRLIIFQNIILILAFLFLALVLTKLFIEV